MRVYRPAVDCLNLSKAGWTWGCVSAIDANGRTIWIVDAYCDEEKRFIVVHAEISTAAAIRENYFTAARKASDSFCNFSLIFFASALLTSIDLPSAAVAAINFPSLK